MKYNVLDGPDRSFGPVVARNYIYIYWVCITTGWDIFHRDCALTVIQLFKSPECYVSALCGDVHRPNEELLKSFNKSRE